MTDQELDAYLAILSKYNVTRFKKAGLEIELQPYPVTRPIPDPPPAKPQVTEDFLPPDLKADELMKEDTILNWSSPDSGEPDLPLTTGNP